MSVAKPLLLLAVSGFALPLAACKFDNRPLLAPAAPPPPALAYEALPQPGPLGPEADIGAPPPPPPRARPYVTRYAAPAEAYPYAERVYGYDAAFYDEPPDYAFAYGDEAPWAWLTADDALMFVEPYGEDDRFYYYEPGAAYPYFVRDAGYGYAYGPDGGLIAIFDAAGALLSADLYPRYYTVAERDWTRGHDLRRVFVSAPRFAVDPQQWRARQPIIARRQQPWLAAPDRQPAWRAWRASAPARMVQHYDAVRPARIAAAQPPGNGLHLGWERGRHEGWARHGAPPVVTGTAPRMGVASVASSRAAPVVRGPARPEPPRVFARKESRPMPPQRMARAAPPNERFARAELRPAPRAAEVRAARPAPAFRMAEARTVAAPPRAAPPRAAAAPQPRQAQPQAQARGRSQTKDQRVERR